LQDELGLNTYAYGWRDYDPAIGRFMKMDRFAEKYHRYTPYGYAGNNPVLVNDIQGDSLWINHKGNNYLYEFSKKGGGKLYTVAGGKKSEYTGKVNGFLGKSFDALNALNSGSDDANAILGDIQSSESSVTISHSSNNPNGNRNEFIEGNKSNSYAFARLLTGQGLSKVTNIGSGGTVYWNPNAGSVWELNNSNKATNTTTNLFHEMVHGWDSVNGNLDSSDYNGTGLSVMEYRAVYYENQARMDLNANKREFYKSTYDANGSLIPYPPRTLDSSNSPIFVAPPSIYFLMK
jgi:RHS repeat-associated protein